MKPGTSLIELLIAIGAISVVLITIAAAASQSLSTGIFSKTQARATKQAEEQMERIRAFRDRNGLASLICDTQCFVDGSLILSSSPLPPVENLTVWFEINNPPVLCPAGDTKVAAYAEWTDAKGTHQSKVVSCFSDWRG